MRILILIPILSLPGPGSWWRGNWTTGSTWTRTKWDGRPPPSSQVRQQTQSCLFMWRRWQFDHLSLKKRFASSSPLSRQHRLPERQRSGPNLKDRPCHLRPTTRQLFLYFLVYTKKKKKKMRTRTPPRKGTKRDRICCDTGHVWLWRLLQTLRHQEKQKELTYWFWWLYITATNNTFFCALLPGFLCENNVGEISFTVFEGSIQNVVEVVALLRATRVEDLRQTLL